MRSIGVDFGTTNSALAVLDHDRTDAAARGPRLARFQRSDGEQIQTFRSLLYFEKPEGEPLREWAGPAAIDRYLDSDEPGRLVQSLKSFLAARDFTATNILGSPYRLEALIGVILAHLRTRSEADLGPLEGPVVVGRPIHFAAANSEADDDFAIARLRAAFRNAGFGEVRFEYEPVAAAYHYERALEQDELILIADFGGGTSDFCLLRVGPGFRGGDRAETILGTEGVAIAGDAFDGRIVRHVLAPLLGMGTRTRSMFGTELTAPSWIYRHLQRWHHLSFLRAPKTMQILHGLCREAAEPARFEALLHLIDHNLGFELHREIEGVKLALSSEREAPFRFVHGPIGIHETVPRSDFSSWIWDDVCAITGCVERLLERTNVSADAVDRVFMTGGTSFVPAVRAFFADRFGADKIRAGGELTSVASGLALRAAEP